MTSALTAPPANARISVWLIVPIMSRPTVMPEENSARHERRGFAAAISQICEVTDMEMSMMGA